MRAVARALGVGRDARGAVSVEFALVLPLMLTLYLGGFATSEAVTTWRKLNDATAQLGNVAAQFTTMQASDAQGVMAAAAQIMSPYSTTNLAEVMTLVSVSAAGAATVTWSQAYNGGLPLAKGAPVTLPTGLVQAGMSVLWVQTSYTYSAGAGGSYVPPITMTNQIYAVPRSSTSIPCSDC
jgi:Flp pilus assembly protein TadG